jgi:uncharacterized protein YdeI (YjbR/CyaY-like superfamily)
MKDDVEQYYANSRPNWRRWLQTNHVKKDAVWLVCYKKSTGKPTISWSDSVDEALCFGWIDSVRRSLTNETFIQFFTKRKPGSGWSKINKDKVARLLEEGLMTQAGLKVIGIAKRNGSWTSYDAIEELRIPSDLNKKIKEKPAAMKFFASLPKSDKKRLLHWVVSAKKSETRLNRIEKFVTATAKGLKPI